MNKDIIIAIICFTVGFAASLPLLSALTEGPGDMEFIETTTSFADKTTTTSNLLPSSSTSTSILPVFEEVFFFYSPSCPHCMKEKAYLEGFEKTHPDVAIHYILSSENPKEFSAMAKKYNTSTRGVPRTFIGNIAFVGFTETSCELRYRSDYKAYVGCGNQLEKAILN